MTQDLVWYVGSTDWPRSRENQHRTLGKNKTYSKFIPREYEWEMVILDKCDKSNRFILEQHYYDMLNPLFNAIRPKGLRSHRV